MNPGLGIIYETRNTINGKLYRGQHICGRHCAAKCTYLGSGKLMKQAIRKYGRENFTRRTLLIAPTNRLNDHEQTYVNKAWLARTDVYNLRTGGQQAENAGMSEKLSRGHKKWWDSPAGLAEREKRRQRMLGNTNLLGVFPNAKTRGKIAETSRGKQPALGMKHTQETRERISASLRVTWAKRRQAKEDKK